MAASRSVSRIASLALLSVLAIGATACKDDSTGPGPEQFNLALTGAAERPTPVTTSASGTANLTVAPDTITYRITVTGLDSATAGHLHIGGPNVAGGVIVGLFSGPATPIGFTGQLTQGIVTRSTPLSLGVTFDSLKALMRTGGIYVNVHTRRNGGGELRGQVGPTP